MTATDTAASEKIALAPMNARDFNDTMGDHLDSRMPLMLNYEANWPLIKVFFRVIGTALILMSAGMWVVQTPWFTPDLILLKFGSSLFFLMCGLALLMRNHTEAQPDAFFDPIRREVRVLEKDDRGRPRTVLRRSYDSLGGANIQNKTVQLWDVDGSLLMRLVLDDDDARRALRAQLGVLVRPAN